MRKTPSLLLRAPVPHVTARYHQSPVPQYRGNPFIEALPPMLPAKSWMKIIQHLPPFKEGERTLPAETRLHCVMQIRTLFVSQNRHQQLREKLDMLLRAAYVGSTTDEVASRKRAQQLYETLQTGELPDACLEDESSGEFMSLVGSSGMGKSLGIKRYLMLLAQVIRHDELQLIQIAYLYVECPHNGSTRDFAQSLVLAIDIVLGTTYRVEYKGLKEEELIVVAASLFNKYRVGLLIIDEIQTLSHRKSGGREEFFDFFLKLFNTLNLSIIVIGTMQAVEVLRTTFRQARRVSSLGTDFWTHFKREDRDWQRLVQSLWSYQWLPKPTPWSEEIDEALFNETQGVSSVLVRLLILLQLRAIRLNDQPLTPELIRHVAQENFKVLQPMLDALRSGIASRIARFEDFRIPDVSDFPEAYTVGKRTSLHAEESAVGITAEKNDTRQKVLAALEQRGELDASAEFHLNEVLAENPRLAANKALNEVTKRQGRPSTSTAKRGKVKGDKPTKPELPGDYDAAKSAGWVAPPFDPSDPC
jgi:hypothetical protein